MKKNDISTFSDIKILVDNFYTYVLNDSLLKPVFEKYMTHNLEDHKRNIYNFWAFLLLNQKSYQRNVMKPHLVLEVSELHFLRWFYYFRRTIYENFEGPLSISAIKRAEVILFTMQQRLLHKDKLGLIP